MFHGTGHRHVELAVDDFARRTVHILVAGEESQLIVFPDGEAVDDVLALASLIALHGVDHDVVERFDVVAVYLVAYGGNLIAIGHDDAHRAVFVEALWIHEVDAMHRGGDHPGLDEIHLVGGLLLA